MRVRTTRLMALRVKKSKATTYSIMMAWYTLEMTAKTLKSTQSRM